MGNLTHVQWRKNGERTVQRTSKERCGERWGEAASRELRMYSTYQPSEKWCLATIPSIEFYYFDVRETVLRAYRDSSEAKSASGHSQLSRRVFSLLKYKQSGTIARQMTCAWSSSLHDTQDLSFIVFCRDIM